MHCGVARHSLDFARYIDKLLCLWIGVILKLQRGICRYSLVDSDVKLKRDLLCYYVNVSVRHSKSSADVADSSPCRHCTE